MYTCTIIALFTNQGKETFESGPQSGVASAFECAWNLMYAAMEDYDEVPKAWYGRTDKVEP